MKWAADFHDAGRVRHLVTCGMKAEAREVEAREQMKAHDQRRFHVDPHMTLDEYAQKWFANGLDGDRMVATKA